MPDPIKPTAAEEAALDKAVLEWLVGDEGEALNIIALHAQQAREQALEEALGAQPSTAENPNEDAYQRGRFDGIMEFAKAILALKEQPPC